MPRFVFEADRDGNYDIYDTSESGLGRNNAVGWVDKYNRQLFNELLNISGEGIAAKLWDSIKQRGLDAPRI